MAYGTALASFNVEEFGTERVARLTGEEIAARVQELREMTHFSERNPFHARERLSRGDVGPADGVRGPAEGYGGPASDAVRGGCTDATIGSTIDLQWTPGPSSG